MIRIGTHVSGCAQIFEPNQYVTNRAHSAYLFCGKLHLFHFRWIGLDKLGGPNGSEHCGFCQ